MGVVSRADQTMRHEQWSLMAFDSPPDGDWSALIATSSWGEGDSRQTWWDRHVVQPSCTPRPHATVNALEGYMPRGATLVTDGSAQSAAGSRPPPALMDAGPFAAEPPAKKRRVRNRGGGRGVGGDGAAPPPAQAKATCFAFNVGKCPGAPGTTCSRGFVHRCSVVGCGADHAAASTPGCREAIDGSGRPIKGKGKGGGKW